jgi:hypothetical protein
MAKSISRTEKRTRGRPATNPTSIHLTLAPGPLAEVDRWIEKQKEPDLSRPEAIRRLVEIGLAGAKKFAAPSQQTRAKAKKFAAEQIDRMGNSTATAEEQARRKQRLLKGPEEFREARVDRPKAKRPSDR